MLNVYDFTYSSDPVRQQSFRSHQAKAPENLKPNSSQSTNFKQVGKSSKPQEPSIQHSKHQEKDPAIIFKQKKEISISTINLNLKKKEDHYFWKFVS